MCPRTYDVPFSSRGNRPCILGSDCTYYGPNGDIITPLHTIERGYMSVPEGHGLGVTVDDAKVAIYRV